MAKKIRRKILDPSHPMVGKTYTSLKDLNGEDSEKILLFYRYIVDGRSYEDSICFTFRSQAVEKGDKTRLSGWISNGYLEPLPEFFDESCTLISWTKIRLHDNG